MLGVSVGALRSAHVGSGDRQILDIETLDVGDKYAAGIERVDGNDEETLNLVGVEVHRHDAVDTCRNQKVGDEFGSYRHARTVLAVLTRPTEVGHHRDDFVGRSAAGRVDHHKQFHQVVRGRKRRLDDEYRATSDRFVVERLELAVAELEYFRIAERCAVAGHDLLGQITRVASRKKLDLMNSHCVVCF